MSNFKRRLAGVVLAVGLVVGGAVAAAPDAHAKANGLKVTTVKGGTANGLANGLRANGL